MCVCDQILKALLLKHGSIIVLYTYSSTEPEQATARRAGRSKNYCCECWWELKLHKLLSEVTLTLQALWGLGYRSWDSFVKVEPDGVMLYVYRVVSPGCEATFSKGAVWRYAHLPHQKCCQNLYPMLYIFQKNVYNGKRCFFWVQYEKDRELVLAKLVPQSHLHHKKKAIERRLQGICHQSGRTLQYLM